MGVGRGDVVTLQLPNWNEFVALMLSLERIGAVVNPVAPIFREREVAGMFKLARPVAVVAPAELRGFGHTAMMRELQDQTPSLRHVVSVGEGDDTPTMAELQAFLEAQKVTRQFSRTRGGRGRDACDPERQDPELQAARDAHGQLTSASQ